MIRGGRGGDALAKGTLADGGRILGRALASAHTLLDLDIVVLCGGVAACSTDFCDSVRTELRERVLDPTSSPLLAVSAIAEDSSVVGATFTGLGARGDRRGLEPGHSNREVTQIKERLSFVFGPPRESLAKRLQSPRQDRAGMRGRVRGAGTRQRG